MIDLNNDELTLVRYSLELLSDLYDEDIKKNKELLITPNKYVQRYTSDIIKDTKDLEIEKERIENLIKKVNKGER